MVSKILLGGVLVVNSITDIKYKKISLVFNLISAITLIVEMLIFERANLLQIVLGFNIGIITLGVSILSKGAIGLGDGIVLCIVGMVCGFINSLIILLVSLILSFLYGVYCIVVKGKSSKYTFAFIPFVVCGYLISI